MNQIHLQINPHPKPLHGNSIHSRHRIAHRRHPIQNRCLLPPRILQCPMTNPLRRLFPPQSRVLPTAPDALRLSARGRRNYRQPAAQVFPAIGIAGLDAMTVDAI